MNDRVLLSDLWLDRPGRCPRISSAQPSWPDLRVTQTHSLNPGNFEKGRWIKSWQTHTGKLGERWCKWQGVYSLVKSITLLAVHAGVCPSEVNLQEYGSLLKISICECPEISCTCRNKSNILCEHSSTKSNNTESVFVSCHGVFICRESEHEREFTLQP